MAYNTKEIVTDKNGSPISQYYNPTADQYEPLQGAAGGNKVVVYSEDGTESDISLLPILDKLSELTGSVVDEETRKSNELQRIAFYNQLQQMLASGELKGTSLEYSWNGTKLGVKTDEESEFIYVDLKGDRGSDGVITNLEGQFAFTIKEDGNLYIIYADGATPPDAYINAAGELILNI